MQCSGHNTPLQLSERKVHAIIAKLDPYLRQRLLPFWLDRVVDRGPGGFLTYFDRDGQPTGKTLKTLVGQLRNIFTLSSVHRAGLDDGRALDAARQGVLFVIRHFWDREYGGWYWITDREGHVQDDSKIMYGQCFGVYALAEYALASGDPQGKEYAEATFNVIQRSAADSAYGGYWEMFRRNWSLKPGELDGGNRKTLDVHMHLMEAFTALYELTGSPTHRRKLEEIIQVLTARMLHPRFHTGLAQFDAEFHPLPAILFRNVWGSDRDTDAGARPLNNTNYGHNLELCWLLKHAVEILGADLAPYLPIIKAMNDQAIKFGVDWEYGGVYVEGPHDGPATQTLKEFWQQAEVLVGFLDAVELFREQPYWDAFEDVFAFVWDKMINHEVGEWYALLERDGRIKWDYLGHEWKCGYHTVRAVIQSLARLRRLQPTVNADG
ncbi:MAG: AGE family epimerase/isomerase [Verrucomicrobia bacterium]|nr:AGE family epimerase/isomerase [Verrucomicrobiota bacterium]MBU1735609.1 AGE family epimerase/isomerase [Verrucomicrobiota bacterium]MBU1855873.1 AGE family epimerase/isomerase [Verrucomicrobiota bacterium]